MNNPFKRKSGDELAETAKVLNTTLVSFQTEKQAKPGTAANQKKRERKPLAWRFVRLSIKEQTLFAKRLSFLIKAGSPILEGLRMLSKFRSKAKTRIFDQIIKGVENGQSLSVSMAKFNHIFGDFAINIIKVGETIGILEQNLAYLAEELRKKHELRRKIISALIYPCFIIIATLGIVILLLTFVFPKVLPVFASLNMTLPWTTRLLIFASDFAVNYGVYFLGGALALAIAFLVLIKKNKKIKKATDGLILRLPLIGKMVQSYQLTNFFRTLGLLLKSGMTLSGALAIIGDSTPNLVYKNEIQKLAKNVTKGKKISSEIEKTTRLFPEISVHMIATGEFSGNLSETALYLADMYENEVDELTKNLSGALEPALMVTMGLIVGFMAISIITPIYAVTQHLSPR
jgi:type II secretory pathway component PulF